MTPPTPLAMVICDAVFNEPATHKKTILGTWDKLWSYDFPFRSPTIAVYLALTDACGRVPLIMQLVDVDEERPPVTRNEFDLDFGADRTTVAEALAEMRNVVFPVPGDYRLQLLVGSQLVGERRIILTHRPRPPGMTPQAS